MEVDVNTPKISLLKSEGKPVPKPLRNANDLLACPKPFMLKFFLPLETIQIQKDVMGENGEVLPAGHQDTAM